MWKTIRKAKNVVIIPSGQHWRGEGEGVLVPGELKFPKSLSNIMSSAH